MKTIEQFAAATKTAHAKFNAAAEKLTAATKLLEELKAADEKMKTAASAKAVVKAEAAVKKAEAEKDAAEKLVSIAEKAENDAIAAEKDAAEKRAAERKAQKARRAALMDAPIHVLAKTAADDTEAPEYRKIACEVLEGFDTADLMNAKLGTAEANVVAKLLTARAEAEYIKKYTFAEAAKAAAELPAYTVTKADTIVTTAAPASRRASILLADAIPEAADRRDFMAAVATKLADAKNGKTEATAAMAYIMLRLAPTAEPNGNALTAAAEKLAALTVKIDRAGNDRATDAAAAEIFAAVTVALTAKKQAAYTKADAKKIGFAFTFDIIK